MQERRRRLRLCATCAQGRGLRSSVRTFIREAAVRKGSDGGPPIPLWKVQVPTHIGQRPVPSEPLSSYLARRAEELSLSVSRTAHGSEESWHSGAVPFAWQEGPAKGASCCSLCFSRAVRSTTTALLRFV
jgi:hypothetical protein